MNQRTASDDITQYGYHQELHRSLSFTDLLVYGLVFMVPIAPFGIFGSVFQGSGGMVALAYAIGMVAMMFTALSYSEMSQAFPMAGSVYTYAGRGIAAPVGFLAGWMILLDYILVPSLLYLIAGVAMNTLVSAIPVWLWIVAFVVLNTAVNFAGIELTAKVNKVMLIAELVVLAVFIVIGIVALLQGKGRGFDLTPVYDSSTFSLPLVFGAVSIAVLSFLGFDGISTLAEENKESSKAIGRSMIAALLLAGVLFIVQTRVAALLVPDPGGLIKNGDPAGTAFLRRRGRRRRCVAGQGHRPGHGDRLGIRELLGCAGCDLAAALRDGPRPAAAVLPGQGAPEEGRARQRDRAGGRRVAGGRPRDGGADERHHPVSTLVNFGALTAFLALNVSVVVHYVVRRGSRDWWKHLVVPVVGFVILAYVLVNAQLEAKYLGLIWFALGVVVLLVLLALGRRPELSLQESPETEDAR